MLPRYYLISGIIVVVLTMIISWWEQKKSAKEIFFVFCRVVVLILILLFMLVGLSELDVTAGALNDSIQLLEEMLTSGDLNNLEQEETITARNECSHLVQLLAG